MAENGGWFREYSDGTNKRRYLLTEPGFCFVMLCPFHSTCAFSEPGIEPGTCDFRVRRASHSAVIRRPLRALSREKNLIKMKEKSPVPVLQTIQTVLLFLLTSSLKKAITKPLTLTLAAPVAVPGRVRVGSGVVGINAFTRPRLLRVACKLQHLWQI